MESLFTLFASFSALLSTSVVQAPVQEVVPPVIIVEQERPTIDMELISQDLEAIHSILRDDQNNNYILSFSEEQLKVSFLPFQTNEFETLGSLSMTSEEQKTLHGALSPQNTLFITWIKNGHVHLTQWSESKQAFINIQGVPGGSTNISGSLDPSNSQSRVWFDRTGKVYLTWLQDPTFNIPKEFHTQSIPHHDFYITTWDGTQWLKIDGRPWFERISDYFPTSLSIYQYDVTFDEENNPLIIWTRTAEDLAFEEFSELYLTRYSPEHGWHSYQNTEDVLSQYIFSDWIENPSILFDETDLILGWQSTQLTEAQIEPQVYKLLNNAWTSISPSSSADTQRFELQKTRKGLMLLDFRPYNLVVRTFKDGTWSKINDYDSLSSPYQTVFPTISAKYFVGALGETFAATSEKLWKIVEEKEG